MNQETKNRIKDAATIAAFIVGIYATFKALLILILIFG
jgi:hypothetical protein